MRRGLLKDASEAFDHAISYAGEGSPDAQAELEPWYRDVKREVLRELRLAKGAVRAARVLGFLDGLVLASKNHESLEHAIVLALDIVRESTQRRGVKCTHCKRVWSTLESALEASRLARKDAT